MLRIATWMTMSIAVALGTSPTLLADTCVWSYYETGTSSSGRYTVAIRWNRGVRDWEFVWLDTQQDQSQRGTIEGLESHAHPRLFVTDDGSRFVIADLTAGHRWDHRILIYEPSGTLVRSLAIQDILMFHERERVSWSVSHTGWTGYDRERKKSIWLNASETDFCLVTLSENQVRISLDDGKVRQSSWKLQLFQDTPWIWLGIAVLLVLFRIVQFATGVLKASGLFLDLSIVIVTMIGCALLGLWSTMSELHYIAFWHSMTLIQTSQLALLCLLVTWVMLGKTSWLFRAVLIIVGLFAIESVPLLYHCDQLFAFFADTGEQSRLMEVVLGIFHDSKYLAVMPLGLIAGMLVVSSVWTWRGKSLRQAQSFDSERPGEITVRKPQFGTLDLLFCVGFIACMLAFERHAGSKWADSYPYLTHVLAGLRLSIFVAVIAWTALTSKPPALVRCGLLLLVLTCSFYITPSATAWRYVGFTKWAPHFCLFTTFYCLLIIHRLHGYRLTDGLTTPL
ncbi:hypothetical protein [Novipirellula artificiosorum]|uniref:Uncharacterized protein n=1 Tax=Novipirellula artificiosorum TaxID=2528016 RepID=A0A5C6CIP7_9BACT|nr:hypothetical protein [Novipirellula artificiosorum]TWU24460.1 hypothetical protein Poly41_70900 [Novipirellula artificiosorum]